VTTFQRSRLTRQAWLSITAALTTIGRLISPRPRAGGAALSL